MASIEDYIITIPDFPEPGIMFRDITGILDMSAALVALILIFFQFAMAGNGVLLTLVFMVFVPFHMAFEYVNTLVNYEKKEI